MVLTALQRVVVSVAFSFLIGCTSQSAIELVRVIDGDTIIVMVGDNEERVRFIGMNAGEPDECGGERATEFLVELLAAGEGITLVEGTKSDRDGFGRLLRYVESGGLDLGLELIRAGLAVAHYDSLSGYPKHDRQTEYRQIDRGSIVGCP